MNLNQKKEKEGDVSSLCVAHVIGALLQPIGREPVFIEDDMVVSWSACALKKTCKMLTVSQCNTKCMSQPAVKGMGATVPESRHGYTGRNQTRWDGICWCRPRFLEASSREWGQSNTMANADAIKRMC